LSSISSPGEIHSVSSHEHHLNKPVLLGGKIESSATDKKVQFAENLTTHIKDVSEEGTIKNVKPIASQSVSCEGTFIIINIVASIYF
jgi:hypothetical protein